MQDTGDAFATKRTASLKGSRCWRSRTWGLPSPTNVSKKKKSTCGMIDTEHLLTAVRRLQTFKKGKKPST